MLIIRLRILLSPPRVMQSDDLHLLINHILRTAPGARVSVITVELPPTKNDQERETAPDSRTRVLNASPIRCSPGGVPQVREQFGNDACLKPRDWRSYVRLSERELHRAIDHGALSAVPKGDGRDHAAMTISTAQMEAYLLTVAAVERGDMEPPSWWDAVRPRTKTRLLAA